MDTCLLTCRPRHYRVCSRYFLQHADHDTRDSTPTYVHVSDMLTGSLQSGNVVVPDLHESSLIKPQNLTSIIKDREIGPSRKNYDPLKVTPLCLIDN